MAYFRLSQGQARYYLVARNGFHVSSSVLVLSVDEIELVEILRGILSVSRRVKDMNEAWFAKAGLNPALGDMFFPMFNLGKMKSSDGAGSGSTAPSIASAPTVGDARVSTIEKRPSSEAGVGLRKCLRKVAAKQPTDASGSIARISADKGKGMVELEEVPERGYTMQELCKVEDRVGVDKYFISIMTQLKCVDSKDPLVPSLDGAHLEGDVFSLTEVAAFLEAELKTEGQKVVATYKASRGFKSGLEKMGRVSYEFGYRVALERLRGKHPDITIEWDPLECSKYANVEMDLDQPFDDDTPFEKQLTL
ncbi:hypothetical protein BHM03_00052908 [Ensete ventricosum]|nr:hypothetical protein BHM03_00052908 [Ensete ventricosum]